MHIAGLCECISMTCELYKPADQIKLRFITVPIYTLFYNEHNLHHKYNQYMYIKWTGTMIHLYCKKF